NIVIDTDVEDDIFIPVTLTVTGLLSDDSTIPLENHLSGNYPNPFNPITTIKFGLKENADVRLVIYNSKGQKVRTLINENREAGYHQITWNGKDDSGRVTSSGIYFYKLKTGDGKFSSTKKMILMK
ncbi:MAG TPA: T9SS type A sorting domain-containing protein, partial [Candidatus Cloacimonetes bacterium]|nr:T9SS type A sorting domain-containing protein [Candidatus Cloacimonadota bacterium]